MGIRTKHCFPNELEVIMQRRFQKIVETGAAQKVTEPVIPLGIDL